MTTQSLFWCIYVSCSLDETWVNVISIGFIGQVVPILSLYCLYSLYCSYKKTRKHYWTFTYSSIHDYCFLVKQKVMNLNLDPNNYHKVTDVIVKSHIKYACLIRTDFLSRTLINHQEPVKKNSISLRSSRVFVKF